MYGRCLCLYHPVIFHYALEYYHVKWAVLSHKRAFQHLCWISRTASGPQTTYLLVISIAATSPPKSCTVLSVGDFVTESLLRKTSATPCLMVSATFRVPATHQVIQILSMLMIYLSLLWNQKTCQVWHLPAMPVGLYDLLEFQHNRSLPMMVTPCFSSVRRVVGSAWVANHHFYRR